jgi:hypothetical protein
MGYRLVKKILWADFFLGFLTGAAGLILYPILNSFLGLPAWLIIIIAAVTFSYSILAFILARQPESSQALLRVLVYANWIWTLVSVALIFFYIGSATIFGAIFLVLQVLVVGLLAWLEGRHLQRPPVIPG